MSGGYFDYENNKIFEWASKIWIKKSSSERELSEILRDLGDVLHLYDFWQCGDVGEEDFEKGWKTFKNKWMVKE